MVKLRFKKAFKIYNNKTVIQKGIVAQIIIVATIKRIFIYNYIYN